MSRLSAIYILAKNEQENIERCLVSSLEICDTVVVLDSGSNDRTLEICGQYERVTLRPFDYRNHCVAYNQIVTWHSDREHIAVLDADMQIPQSLAGEVEHVLASEPTVEAIIAPVMMYWDAEPLRYSSLYPPKPIVFRGGRPLFEPAGHGEHLIADAKVAYTKEKLIHDDRKPLDTVLANQWRYAKDTVRRSLSGKVTRRDRIRLRSPLMMLIVPLYALIIRRGLLDGKQGIIYAIDRLIAEALTYRASLSATVRREVAAEGASREDEKPPSTSERTTIDS